jgi:O-antigen/teichoic acid export membrane protein
VLLENVTRQLSQPLLASVVVILGGGVLTLSGAYLIPYGLGLVASVWWARRLWLAQAWAETEETSPVSDQGIGWEFWRFSGPRAVGRISQVGLRRADIVLVAALAGPGEAAVYTAATRFMTLGQLGVRAIQQVLGPQLSRLLVEGNQTGARTVVQTATAWSIILAWPVYLGCASLAPTVLKLFDVGSREATLVVVILASAMLVAIGTGPVDVALLMAGKSVLSLSNNLAALIVNIGLDLFLIPEYGIVGAAVGWACGLLVGNLLPTFQVHRELGFWAVSRSSALAATATLASLGIVPLWVRLIGGSQGETAAAFVLGLLVYLAMLVALREPLHLGELVKGTVPRRRKMAA